MNVIEPAFFDKKFSVQRYMLRYVVGAATDELREQQLQKVRKYRAMADDQIDGVIDQSFVNFNTSLARFTAISNQLQETRDKVQEVQKRAADGRAILGSKTKNLRELLLQKYEAKKVVDIINDIECIEAAPSKIEALLQQCRFLDAVDQFASALDLVFSEQLVAFHATTGLRTDLMECKQTIEDRLVQELQRTIYLKRAFTNITSRTNQYSLSAIENELNSDTQLDQQFDQLILRALASKANGAGQSRKSCTDTPASVLPAPIAANNALQTAVSAVKKLHREREAIGTIKRSIEHELDEVVEELSRLCRGIFNSSSTTSFANAFTEATFGTHEHSSDFGTFLRLLFSVLRRVAQRHYLVAIFFEADGDNWDYGMFEVVTRISRVLERVLGEYLEGATSSQPAAHDPALASDSDSGELFKLSRNKPTTHNRLDGDDQNDPAHSRLVCEPSVFHLPEVYEDLERIGKDLQQLFRASINRSGTNSSAPALSGFTSFLSTFITQKWIPKVKTKAQHFMAIKARSLTTMCRLPIPSDTSYQPPSIDCLLHVVENLRIMMTKMPTHASDLSSVLEAAVLNWLDECAVIVRDIREQTLNHQQLQNKGVTYADLGAIFHEYEGYQRAKQGSPIPFHHSKVQPMSNGIASTRVRAEEAIAAKELDLENSFYDPDAWIQGHQGLLMDNARIGMLGYANSACDLIAKYLQRIAGGSEGKSSSNGALSSPSSPALTMALQAASWKCSALADECLLFLRREIRLHCCYYLTQLVSQRFDMEEGHATMAQESVLTLNLNLSSVENALQPYLASDKMSLVFNGIDALLARLLIGNLSQMADCTFTRGGVQQMLLNIGALRQGLTGTLYSYPRDGAILSSSTVTSSSCSSASRLEHAKRYYQLLNLSETQIEMFLLANRGAYTHEAFRALWHVEAPHRPLSKGSVNKLDSLLR
ncbi:Exocyst complex component 4 [Phytophthora boehmeriae]|uniref:Exocyst complex component Sec8 n=1 Tax=Phytophthora boehmeriae TaxID=109152 RepID=A0A8T1X959_9STRA|nr:Exocyst complex component 4 [Phytophthora boehmeriae]